MADSRTPGDRNKRPSGGRRPGARTPRTRRPADRDGSTPSTPTHHSSGPDLGAEEVTLPPRPDRPMGDTVERPAVRDDHAGVAGGGEDDAQTQVTEQIAAAVRERSARTAADLDEGGEAGDGGAATSWRGKVPGLGRFRGTSGPRQVAAKALATAPGAERISHLLAVRSSAEQRPRARFTGRAAILVLVLAALTMSFASSLRAYVQQRDHLQQVREEVRAMEDENTRMQSEVDRFKDPAYENMLARENLNYVMPGERAFVTLGADGKPLDSSTSLRQPAEPEVTRTPWWTDTWDSVKLAGNPPVAKKKYDPNTTIDGTKPEVAE